MIYWLRFKLWLDDRVRRDRNGLYLYGARLTPAVRVQELGGFNQAQLQDFIVFKLFGVWWSLPR